MLNLACAQPHVLTGVESDKLSQELQFATATPVQLNAGDLKLLFPVHFQRLHIGMYTIIKILLQQ